MYGKERIDVNQRNGSPTSRLWMLKMGEGEGEGEGEDAANCEQESEEEEEKDG